MAKTVMDICPQPGPQTDFLATSADLAVYGGWLGAVASPLPSS